MRGREPHTIIWDDEAGTVAGDHSRVAPIRARFDAPKPVTIGGPWGMWDLVDPAHDPVEFLTLLADEYWPILDPLLRETLPADVYFGCGQAILLERERIKRKTIEHRRLQHRDAAA